MAIRQGIQELVGRAWGLTAGGEGRPAIIRAAVPTVDGALHSGSRGSTAAVGKCPSLQTQFHLVAGWQMGC